MATEFLPSPIFSKSPALTSEATSIVASTDESKISASLTCNGVTFFSSVICSYDGKAELFDPGSLIEAHFQANQLICDYVTVNFGDASKSILFLYCEHVMPAEFDPNAVPLLSSTARRLHKNSRFTVAALHGASDTSANFTVKAVGHDADGVIDSVQFGLSANLSHKVYATFPVSRILDNASGLKDVMFFSVELGTRQLMCYITPAPAYLTFQFRNIFNVPEFVDVEGTMVTKQETSRQSARCSGMIIQYDRRTDRTYQFTSGPLPADEVESLTQLVSSSSVQLYADGSFHDIVVEEHTCEESTDDESLSVIKFTWRFKGRRPVRFNSALFGIQPSRREIFSDEYSPEYE